MPTQAYTQTIMVNKIIEGYPFRLLLPYADTQAMSIFLTGLSKEYSQYRGSVLMDDAAWHKPKNLGVFENISIIFLPAYSPDLNPVEHLWEHIREKYFWNRSWKSLDALEDTLSKALNEVSRPNML